jgi:starch synthase (maltosyl-transferring)
LNDIRRGNPPLQKLTNLAFLPADNEQILFYGKSNGDDAGILLIAVNLDPSHPQECSVTVPPSFARVPPGSRYEVTDLLTGAIYNWGESNYVRLDPAIEPAHILHISKRL